MCNRVRVVAIGLVSQALPYSCKSFRVLCCSQMLHNGSYSRITAISTNPLLVCLPFVPIVTVFP